MKLEEKERWRERQKETYRESERARERERDEDGVFEMSFILDEMLSIL